MMPTFLLSFFLFISVCGVQLYFDEKQRKFTMVIMHSSQLSFV